MAHLLRFNTPLNGQGDQASFASVIPMEVGDRFELDAVIPSSDNPSSAVFLTQNSDNYFAFNGNSAARIKLAGAFYTGDAFTLSPYVDELTTFTVERFADRYEIRVGDDVLISAPSTQQLSLVRWGQGGTSSYVNMDFYEGRFYSSGTITHQWIPTGSGSTVPDSVGSNNLTLENFATDGSQYIEYAGFSVDQSQVSLGDSITWSTEISGITSAYLEDGNGNRLQLLNVTDSGGSLPALSGNLQSCLFGEVTISITDGADTLSRPIEFTPPTGYELVTLTSVPASTLSTDWVHDFDYAAGIGDQSLENNGVITHNPDGSITWTEQALTYTYYTVKASTGVISEITKTFEEPIGAILPTVDAGLNDTAVDGDTVTLSATASDYDTLLWECTSGQSPTIVDGDTLTPTITFNEVGSHVLQLTATNSEGSSSDTVTYSVSQAPDVTKPVITLLGSSSVTISEGDTYTDAGATATDDRDGDITSDIVVVNPVDVNNAGTYTITYNVTDAAGNVADEVTRTVVVESVVIPNQPPVANAGINQSVVAGATVQLDGTGSTDSDGTIASYTWTQTSGDTVTLTGANTATPSFTAPSTNAAQALTFELTVTDDGGLTATDSVDVQVAAATQTTPPTAKAKVLPASVVKGGLFTLDATDSQNADGYLWEQLEGGEVVITSPGSETSIQAAPSENKPDKLRFKLTVTNESGSDSVEIFVNVRPRLKAKKVIRAN